MSYPPFISSVCILRLQLLRAFEVFRASIIAKLVKLVNPVEHLVFLLYLRFNYLQRLFVRVICFDTAIFG